MALDMKKPTKFVEVTAGSRVAISSANGTYGRYEGTVMEMISEYGPQRIPALVLNLGDNDPKVVQADGQHLVEILLNAKALISQTPPPGTVRMRSIPVRVEAFQFTGGQDNATGAIIFSAGLLNARWEPANENHGEGLVISSLIGEQRIDPGGWLVRTVATEEIPNVRAWVETGDAFLEQYEYDL